MRSFPDWHSIFQLGLPLTHPHRSQWPPHWLGVPTSSAHTGHLGGIYRQYFLLSTPPCGPKDLWPQNSSPPCPPQVDTKLHPTACSCFRHCSKWWQTPESGFLVNHTDIFGVEQQKVGRPCSAETKNALKTARLAWCSAGPKESREPQASRQPFPNSREDDDTQWLTTVSLKWVLGTQTMWQKELDQRTETR